MEGVRLHHAEDDGRRDKRVRQAIKKRLFQAFLFWKYPEKHTESLGIVYTICYNIYVSWKTYIEVTARVVSLSFVPFHILIHTDYNRRQDYETIEADS